ncbi:MAG: hypothetical protein P8Z35_19210 [Ignavibacteriaceae bacterium]
MKLKKKKKLFQLFNLYNVDLVLHGHVHESYEYFRKGIRFLNAGASVLGAVPEELKINFINIQSSGIDTEVHKIFYNDVIIPEVIHKDSETRVFSIIK